MVKKIVIPIYQCELCGLVDENRSIIVKHEKIPIQGLEKAVGSVLRFGKVAGGSHMIDVVLGIDRTDIDHIVYYNDIMFYFCRDKLEPGLALPAHPISSIYSELSTNVYEKFIRAAEKSKDCLEALKPYISDISHLSRGILPKDRE
jgi:hypothetical protein